MFKTVWRYDSCNKIFRLFRFVWDVGTVGDGKGYSNKFSLALTPRFFRFQSDVWEWKIVLLGLRIHYIRSYGGRFV